MYLMQRFQSAVCISWWFLACNQLMSCVGMQADRDLQAQRLNWLQSESLNRLLQEMIQDHCVRKHRSGSSSEDDEVHFSASPLDVGDVFKYHGIIF